MSLPIRTPFLLKNLIKHRFHCPTQNIIFKFSNRTRFSQQEEFISNVVEKNKPLSPENWTDLKDHVLKITNNRNNVNSLNFNGVILKHCVFHNTFTVAKSYIDFLNSRGEEINLPIISNFLLLCSKSLEPVDENIILSFYEKIKKYPLLDTKSNESIIAAISKTKKWKDGFIYLDQILQTSKPNYLSYSSLISAAFNNNEPDIAWKLITEMSNIHPVHLIPDSIYESCLKHAQFNNSDFVIKLFQFFSQTGVYLSHNFTTYIMQWFKSNNINAHLCSISKSGVCNNCSEKLDATNIDEDQFTKMKLFFYKKILIGNNLFLKSSPREFQEFQKFLEKYSPFDIVIDGLNVFYNLQNITAVIDHFHSLNKKILIFGRKHMFHNKLLKKIQNKASIFITDNLSHDDPFLLYATLHSGLGTSLISQDLMRNHAYHYINEPELLKTFRKWQCIHQFQVILKNKKHVVIKPRLEYIPIAQSSNNYWHLPIEDDRINEQRSNILSSPDKWICINIPK